MKREFTKDNNKRNKMKREFTKDNNKKLVDNDEVAKDLVKQGWTETKPKAKKNGNSKKSN